MGKAVSLRTIKTCVDVPSPCTLLCARNICYHEVDIVDAWEYSAKRNIQPKVIRIS